REHGVGLIGNEAWRPEVDGAKEHCFIDAYTQQRTRREEIENTEERTLTGIPLRAGDHKIGGVHNATRVHPGHYDPESNNQRLLFGRDDVFQDLLLQFSEQGSGLDGLLPWLDFPPWMQQRLFFDLDLPAPFFDFLVEGFGTDLKLGSCRLSRAVVFHPRLARELVNAPLLCLHSLLFGERLIGFCELLLQSVWRL